MLALSDEAKGTIEKHIEAKGMTYPVAAGAKSARDYGVSGIPAGFLIGWDGRILWSGNPGGGAWEGPVEEALAEAKRMSDSWDPGEQPSYLKKAVAYARDGDVAKAWRESANLQNKMIEEADALEALQAFQGQISERAAWRSDYAKDMVQSGRVYEAVAYLGTSAKLFKGVPAEEAWSTEIKRLKKEEKELYGLDKKRLDALAKAAKGDGDKALKSLESLRKKASGTAIEAVIDADIQRVAVMAAR